MPNSLIRFEAFLREAEHRADNRKGRTAIGMAGFLCFVAFATVIGRYVIEPSTFFRILAILAFSAFAANKVGESLDKSRLAKLSRRDPLHETYKELIQELKKYSENRTLG